MADLLTKIESLRTKPVAVRNQYAFWGALFITLLIAALWGTTLPARFSNTNEPQEEQMQAESSVWVPLVRMKDSMSNAFGAIAVQLEGLSGEEAAPAAETSTNLDFEAMIASSTAESYVPPQQEPVVASSSTTTASSTQTTP